jgi:phenylalanyl-tRNA synthetase alpha chain
MDRVLSLQEFLTSAENFFNQTHQALREAVSLAELESARIEFLGDRSGHLKVIQSYLRSVEPRNKPEAGKYFNAVKGELTTLLEGRLSGFRVAASAGRDLDLTMPARTRWQGGKHPVTLVIDEIVAIFRELGFTVALGPESESEWYNFGALNFPADHPAMDLHDTLYLGEGALLRTHTSPVQVRTLQRHAPPVRILAPGTAYRRDPFDASHAPAFTQVEGLAVDEGISFGDLKATLTHFARSFFGSNTRTRFRPSYFPFTEPSAEMDVQCQLCKRSGCSACKGTGWMEIMGSGMVHPSVLESAGVDSERYTGWAFGMGPARIAMLRYGLPDIRLLYDSDMRFLEQVSQ